MLTRAIDKDRQQKAAKGEEEDSSGNNHIDIICRIKADPELTDLDVSVRRIRLMQKRDLMFGAR